jgi:transposase-like protein
MSNASLKDIQRALNAIRSELDDANQQTRLEVLQLMLAQSQSIVAMARKLDGEQARKASKLAAKQRKPNRPTAAPLRSAKQQPIKRADNRNTQGAVQATNPINPLPPQRSL